MRISRKQWAKYDLNQPQATKGKTIIGNYFKKDIVKDSVESLRGIK